jgi:hypothetical protein
VIAIDQRCDPADLCVAILGPMNAMGLRRPRRITMIRSFSAAAIFGIFGLGLALAACGTTTQFVSTNPSPRQMHPRPVSSVAVFTASRPEIPYIEVGILQSRQSSGFSSDQMPEIIGAMRKEAAHIGCDGVIVNGAADTTESHETTTVSRHAVTHSGSTQTLQGYWGTCIMYAPEPVAAR